MKQLAKLLKSNHQWRKLKNKSEFEEHAKGQQPKFLFIACADSRVTPSEITQSDLGNIFEERNVAAQVVPTNEDMLSAVEYAINGLDVDHIIVCGHYQCGGVELAMKIAESPDHPPSKKLKHCSNWVQPIVDIYHQHETELQSYHNRDERWAALVRLSVQKQIENLEKIEPVVEARRAPTQKTPSIHGAIYDIASGKVQLVGKDQNDLKKSLDQCTIEEQLLRLSLFAKSLNPLKWIGAQHKHDLIQSALDNLLMNKSSIEDALNDPQSKLYQALNYKRLLPFSLNHFDQSGFFSSKAYALSESKEDIEVINNIDCRC